VFENRVLRRIFGPEREEVAGGWKRLHNEKLHNFYPSSNIIRVLKARKIRWAGHEASVGETINTLKMLARKREGKRPFG
jgi:hypothetical protein